MIYQEIQNYILPIGNKIKCKSIVKNNYRSNNLIIMHELMMCNSDGTWTIVDKQERCFDALFFDFETEYNMVVHGIYSLKTRLKTYMHDYSKTDVKFSSNVFC